MRFQLLPVFFFVFFGGIGEWFGERIRKYRRYLSERIRERFGIR